MNNKDYIGQVLKIEIGLLGVSILNMDLYIQLIMVMFQIR